MRRALALATLLLVPAACTSGATAGSSAPPPGPDLAAPDPGRRAAAPPDDGGGFADPPEASPAAAPRTQHTTTCEPELAERIKRQFGDSCKFERGCGDLVGVNCNAAADGPYYYARRASLEVLSRCGGFCMSGTCTDCPPKGWTCATY